MSNPFYKLLETFDKLEETTQKVTKVGNKITVDDGQGNQTEYDEETWAEMNKTDESIEEDTEQLDEFLPALAGLGARALAGKAGAGTIGKAAAGLVGNKIATGLLGDDDDLEEADVIEGFGDEDYIVDPTDNIDIDDKEFGLPGADFDEFINGEMGGDDIGMDFGLEEAGFEDDDIGFISQPQFKQNGRTPGEQMRDGYDDDVDTGGWDGANGGDNFEPELEEAGIEPDNDFDAGMDSGYSGDLDANYQAGDDEFNDFEPELDADELTKNDEAEYAEFDLKKHGKRLRPGTPVILDDDIGGGEGIFIEKSPSGAFGTVERNGKTISIHLNDIDQADLTHSSVYEAFDKQFNKLMEEVSVTRTNNANIPDNDTITITGTGEHVDMLTDIMKLAGMEGGDGVELPQDVEIPVNIDPSLEMMPRGAIDDAPPMGMEMGDMMGMMDDIEEDYSNEPDERYSDVETQVNGMSGGLNKRKKMFKKGYPGDNDMTVDLEEGKAKQEEYTVYNKKTNTIVKPNLTKHEAEKLVAKDGDNAMGSPAWVADRVNKTTNESKQSFLNLYHKIADLDK